MTHPASQYALDVASGKRVAGLPERQACQRHLDDLKRAESSEYPYTFDETKADRIYRWFDHCRHVEGPLAGQPVDLLPFQQFDLGVMFGWVRKDNSYRRFEKAYIQEGRKNGKTLTLSAVSLYLMVGDMEEAPAVYCAAVDRAQARILYRAAKSMAYKSTDIRKRLKIRDYEISHQTRGGQMVALSKDTKNKDGLNPSGAIIDEYAFHPTSEIYDVLWSAWGQRAQALMTIITTAGMDIESPCYKEYDYCKSILSGEIPNERYFVMIRELDKDDDEHNPTVWIKANPLRAATPAGLAKLQEQHDEAFGSRDPAKIRTFRVKNLNQWVHGQEDSYMAEYLPIWDEQALDVLKFLEMTRERPCIVGVDLSKSTDLTAVSFVFALEDGRVAVWSRGFMPDETIKAHEKTDKTAQYRHWAEQGWLIMTEGNLTHYDLIEDYIQDMELAHGWKIHEITYDPYNATQFANRMQDKGYTCIEVRQGVQTLSEPTKRFRDLAADRKAVHDGSPLLRWCLGNAVTVQDGNENIKLSKKKIMGTRRIDLAAATIDAMVRIPVLMDAVTSVYDTRGVRSL
jgi:phage terminase large subunit-like protein